MLYAAVGPPMPLRQLAHKYEIAAFGPHRSKAVLPRAFPKYMPPRGIASIRPESSRRLPMRVCRACPALVSRESDLQPLVNRGSGGGDATRPPPTAYGLPRSYDCRQGLVQAGCARPQICGLSTTVRRLISSLQTPLEPPSMRQTLRQGLSAFRI